MEFMLACEVVAGVLVGGALLAVLATAVVCR